ncbi:hypothetical protein GQ42DRAFT_164143 [Ramicandelaber brevisporus]|nr:hypothetical protein GQ42DRAFT_164143 [Ramicandelaber brevisporus]
MLELDLKQRQSAVTAGETAATETAAAETTASNGGKRLRLLDVGAVSPDNYVHQSKWVDCTPIDLNPQDERIIKLDILDTPSLKKLLASSAADGATIPDVDGMPQFDVVCLSLVLNFGGDIEDRGRILEQAVRMLQHSASHGLLYIVLPLPCLSNSRYFSQQKLDDILRDAFGFKRIRQHESKALAYSLYQREVAPPKASTRAKFPKAIVEDGPGRNNFVIVVK